MKTRIALILCLALTSSTASARELIKITATKKTASSRSSSPQDLPRGRSVSTEKSIYYAFKIQPQTTELPGEGQVEWIVLVEDVSGKTRPGTHGKQYVDLTFGKVVTVDSDTFELRSREWSTGRTGTIEEKILGYGVRVLNTAGEVLAEKYGPASLSSQVNWTWAKPGTRGQQDQQGSQRRALPNRPFRRPRL